MKILLMGNPNVGKSVVFNRLTGAGVISSNYPGTTVGFTEGHGNIGGMRSEIIDVPGTYSLEPGCKAEEIAVKFVSENSDCTIVNVIDSTNLERNLNLTLQLIKQKKPMIIALNFWDETKHTGISIDVENLEKILGVPCVPVCALTGEGIKTLVDRVGEASISELQYDGSQRWQKIGEITGRVQAIIHRHPSILEKLGDASVKPVTGIPVALSVLFITFLFIRFTGEGLISYIFEPAFEILWTPLMIKLSGLIHGNSIIHNIIIGKLIDGQIDYNQSFGLLTTGLFVPVGAVLPYVIAFYFSLSFLEDSGYLPRLAVMVDTVMHRLGIHGMAIIPMMLGIGCNVPGALSIRILETRREKFISATLMAIAVPCMAQIAMITGLLGRHGPAGLSIIFATLFIAWVIIGLILNRFTSGTSPEIFTEIPPYRVPYIKGLLKKTWMRIKWFVSEAIPFVLLGVFIVNLLYILGVIDAIGKIAGPVIVNILGLPKEAAGALIVGFLRKDVAVGMLAPLNLSMKQLIVASVVLVMYFPCAATFTVLARELGFADMLKSSLIMIISSLAAGGILNLIL